VAKRRIQEASDRKQHKKSEQDFLSLSFCAGPENQFLFLNKGKI
jgi:hypothetical protein